MSFVYGAYFGDVNESDDVENEVILFAARVAGVKTPSTHDEIDTDFLIQVARAHDEINFKNIMEKRKAKAALAGASAPKVKATRTLYVYEEMDYDEVKECVLATILDTIPMLWHEDGRYYFGESFDVDSGTRITNISVPEDVAERVHSSPHTYRNHLPLRIYFE